MSLLLVALTTIRQQSCATSSVCSAALFMYTSGNRENYRMRPRPANLPTTTIPISSFLRPRGTFRRYRPRTHGTLPKTLDYCHQWIDRDNMLRRLKIQIFASSSLPSSWPPSFGRSPFGRSVVRSLLSPGPLPILKFDIVTSLKGFTILLKAAT